MLRFHASAKRLHCSRPCRWAYTLLIRPSQHRRFRSPFNDPACVVVRGTFLNKCRLFRGAVLAAPVACACFVGFLRERQ